jgi:hypothetical protein
MGSGGVGTHVAGELFKMMTGVNVVPVSRGALPRFSIFSVDRVSRLAASREMPME